MKRSSCLLLLAAIPLAASAAVLELADHSRPKAQVRTWHAKCTNGRFGIVRADTTREPTRVCASVQDGSRPEQCLDVAPDAAMKAVRDAAEALCR
jgi:hypothetical protein